MNTVRERVAAICEREKIKPYRLAQLLRVSESSFRRDVEPTQYFEWILLRIEEEGLSWYEAKEAELGKLKM